MKRSEEPGDVDGGVIENDNYRPTNSYWKPWLLWVLANTAVFVLCILPIFIFIFIDRGYLLGDYLYIGPYLVNFIIFGAVAGSILGAFQWLLFRSMIQGAGKWIGGTALSWGLSFPMWFVPSISESGLFFNELYNKLYVDNSILITIIQSGIGPVIFGAIVGLIQWLVLRHQVKHAGTWIITTIIGYTCAGITMEYLFTNALLNIGVAAILIVVGILLGMLTGVGYVYLFDLSSHRFRHTAILSGVSLIIMLSVTLPIGNEFNQPILTILSDSKNALAFSPNGDLLVSVGFEGVIKFWDVETGTEIDKMGTRSLYNRGNIHSMAFSPDGNTLAIYSEGHDSNHQPEFAVDLWDLKSRKRVESFPAGGLFAPKDNHNNFTFSPDGRILTTIKEDSVLVYDVDSGQVVKEWYPEPRVFTSPESWAFSPDGDYLAMGYHSSVRVFSVGTGQIAKIQGFGEEISSIAISPDGKLVATGTTSGDYPVRLWDASSGLEKYRLGRKFVVNTVAFSPDGTLLAVAYWDYPEVELYDVTIGQMLRSLRSHSGTVNLAFSPDSKLLATSTFYSVRDDTIRLWDISDLP